MLGSLLVITFSGHIVSVTPLPVSTSDCIASLPQRRAAMHGSMRAFGMTSDHMDVHCAPRGTVIFDGGVLV